MTSSHKGIIRGAEVRGVVFCSPQGEIESKEEHEKAEKENLQALEDFWLAKGRQEGREEAGQEAYQKGLAEGQARGDQEGYTRGKTEGESIGHQRGLEEGKAAALEELASSVELFKQAQMALGTLRENLLESSRGEIIAFCLAVCRSALQRELSDPDSFTNQVEGLIQQIRPVAKKGEIEVYLNPTDLSNLSDHLGRLNLEEAIRQQVEFLPDDQLGEGCCRVETRMGLLNFDLSRQLEEIEKKALEASDEQEEEPADELVEPESRE